MRYCAHYVKSCIFVHLDSIVIMYDTIPALRVIVCSSNMLHLLPLHFSNPSTAVDCELEYESSTLYEVRGA